VALGVMGGMKKQWRNGWAAGCVAISLAHGGLSISGYNRGSSMKA